MSCSLDVQITELEQRLTSDGGSLKPGAHDSIRSGINKLMAMGMSQYEALKTIGYMCFAIKEKRSADDVLDEIFGPKA